MLRRLLRRTSVLRRSEGSTSHGADTALQTLPVRALSSTGETLVFAHRYRLHQAREGIAQRVVGTGTTRFLAVTVASDGTVWAGGDGGGRLFQVAPGNATAQFVGPLLADPTGRVEDLGVDERGRLHAVVFAPQSSGAIVLEQGVACQTVNVLEPAYPLRDPQGRPSPSTRVVPAADGAVWLLGSDGGVTQVTDTFRDGRCPPTGASVQYGPVLRRQEGPLPTNTVPALVAGRGRDGTLWLGTALGLTRLREGQVTPVLFHREVTVQGDVSTLETFFQAVAQAIFTAQPLETVALGGVSFVEAFGRPLVKEDLIFSAVEEAQGRLWLGTLGGGRRRIEVRDGVPQDTLHLTRQEGLGSNLILALAVGPDGALWAATDEGVSRIRRRGETVEISNFAALENVSGPVRDVAVDAAGTVWLATDAGLFRLQPGSSRAAGGTGSGTVWPRLIPVAGNNQSALPGQELPTPLVVRLEDALGAPVVGTPLTATLLQGDAVFLISEVVLRSIDLPAAVQDQTIRAVAVRGDFAYVLTNSFGNDPGTLQVVSIRDLATARVVHSLPLPVPRPTGLVVAGEVMYVPAGTAGLLVLALRDPARPVLVTTLGDPDPTDTVATEFSSGLALADDFSYVVETYRQRDTCHRVHRRHRTKAFTYPGPRHRRYSDHSRDYLGHGEHLCHKCPGERRQGDIAGHGEY